MVLLRENIPTPDYRLFQKGKTSIDPELLVQEIPFPWVIKPNNEGSSLGITICKSKGDVAKGLELAFQFDREILVEQFIPGREMTVGLVDCEEQDSLVFPVVEIVSKREFYDYQAKYTKGQSEYFCPADLPDHSRLAMQKMARLVHEITGCRGGARVDFRLNPENNPFVIEINTSPGMTELSLLPMGAKAHGLSFADLVELILNTAKTEVSLNWASR
jgi:D-alanine-D-alanine ligase